MENAALSDAELDALLAAVDMSGESVVDVFLTPDNVSLDDGGSSLSLLDEGVWWMVDEESAAPKAVTTASEERATDQDAETHVKEPRQQQVRPHEQRQLAAETGNAYTRVVASRQRAKDELVHLRGRVRELEDQLEKARAQVVSTPPPVLDSSRGSVTDAVDQFWQRLAHNEREARQRALAENLALRSQLEAQLRTARSLEKLLHKRPHHETAAVASTASSLPFKRLRVGADQNAVFASLIADLDTRYHQTDGVFKESGLADRRQTFQDARVRFADGVAGHETTSTSSSCVEFVTSHVVPFSYAMTRDVSWRALQSPSIPLPNGGVYEAIETSDDDGLVKALFTVPTKLRGTHVVSRARFVAKRFIEAHRIVVVWALSSTIQGGILKSHCVELLEEGWSAISPLDINDANELSLTQACGRLRPRMVVRAGSKMDKLVGLLTDVFLDCYHDTQQGLYDFTGRMLLDEAAKHR